MKLNLAHHRLLALGAAALAAGAAAAAAQETGKKPESPRPAAPRAGARTGTPPAAVKSAPGGDDAVQVGDTTINFSSMEFDLAKNLYILTGEVVLISPDTRLTSDRMTVQTTTNREILWARCEGQVTIHKVDLSDKTTIDATCKTLEDFEKDRKANLVGDVVVHQSSPRLAKPAKITGDRVEMDLATDINIVRGVPARVHLEPLGKEGEPTPEPIDLTGTRIEMNNRSQEYVSTGKPVLQRTSGTLQARRIRFQVEGEKKDLKIAYADDDVVYDGKNEKGEITHATGDRGTWTRETNELMLEGSVFASTQAPDDLKPRVGQGDRFIHNTKTGGGKLLSNPGSRGTLVLPSGTLRGRQPAPGEKPGGAGKPPAATGEKKEDTKKP